MDKKELAQRASISTQYLGRLISGRQCLANANVRVLIKLSQILHVSTDYLLGLDTPAAAETAPIRPPTVLLQGACADA